MIRLHPLLLLIILPYLLQARVPLLKQIHQIDLKSNSVQKSINILQEQQKNLSRAFKKRKQKLISITGEKQYAKINLKKRLVFLFQLLNKDRSSLLLSGSTVIEMEMTERFLQKMIAADLKLLKNYFALIDREQKQIKQISETQITLKKQRSQLIQQQKNLQHERQKKVALFKKIEHSEKLKRQVAREWKNASRKLSRKSKPVTIRLKKGSFLKNKGRFNFPVSTRVNRWYEVIYDRKKKMHDIHKGLSFRVKKGTPVKSIYTGQIVYASTLQGSGNTVIIAHGQHYYTIYMHLSKMAKKRGDKVSTGEVIALSGATGYARYPKLYFEIRHRKKPVNLNKWFKIKKRSR